MCSSDLKRDNGKVGELNDTTWASVQFGGRVQAPEGSTIQTRLFYDREDFHQNTFAVPAAVLRDGEMNMGCTEIMSPWGDVVGHDR